MMQIVNMYYFLRVILVQILFLNVINAEFTVDRNATKYHSIQTSERLKRAPTFHRSTPPSVLTATIIDQDEEIHLRWERVDRYLFNENLPVYTAQMNSWGATHKKSNVMKNIGKTITYHDVAQKSAIIYFEEHDAICGVVGQSYEIEMLRVHKLSRPLIVGEGFVDRLPTYGLHGSTKLNPLEIPPYPELSGNFGEASSSNSETREDSISERFYIETLLFVTYDIFAYTHNDNDMKDDVIYSIVISYLLHINAVDMVFAMLPTNQFEVYINLAGIIIEEEDGVFSEILQYPPLKYDNRREFYMDHTVSELFAPYPAHFDFPFAKDSFDLMLVSTGRDLHYNGGVYAGWNSFTADIFLEKQSGNPHPHLPYIMIRSIDLYSQYPLVAHFIGDFLGVENTNPCNSSPQISAEVQCYSVMQLLGYYCSQCITWNIRSISQLETFFRDDPNRCFYLNKPRSLYPAGTPVISVSPCRQCTCFGFHSYGRESRNECPFYIPPENCGEPLPCNSQDGHGRHRVEKSILPFDGTPCGQNKVCWNEACTSMSGTTSQSRV